MLDHLDPQYSAMPLLQTIPPYHRHSIPCQSSPARRHVRRMPAFPFSPAEHSVSLACIPRLRQFPSSHVTISLAVMETFGANDDVAVPHTWPQALETHTAAAHLHIRIPIYKKNTPQKYKVPLNTKPSSQYSVCTSVASATWAAL